ncbi:hypothetical protein BvCmsB5655_03610 [Escherichia coli]|uniref:hypothetical protein n=1 Tax=Escherichia coli TaxID=562 RepID=UPI0010BB555E|nr:hypothetical protein [Escherichia coli]GCJ80755.1 hypothetical protein BvCmsB5655_03610 [Escherichia coli]HDS0644966.1 hypothetical protein [Escherichia coli]
MKFNIAKTSSICIFGYSYELGDIDILLYKTNGVMHFKYQDEEADNYLLPNLVQMQEEELFQYSLIYDIDICTMPVLISIQKVMLDMYDKLIQGMSGRIIEIDI